MKKSPLIFSFFSGAGFLDLGFEKTGFEIALVNECHKPFLDAYMHARKVMGLKKPSLGYYPCSIEKFLAGAPSHVLRKNIAEARKAGRITGFVGGPPCPDFSIGGKNKGRKGPNGKLSEVYVDLIAKHCPDFFVFENVKGLWHTKRHRKFYDSLKNKLAAAGYTLEDRLSNAIEFGVPQDRERILLFGTLNLQCKKLPALDFEKVLSHSKETAFNCPWPAKMPFSPKSRKKPPSAIPLRLTVEHWFQKNNVDSHPNAKHCFKPRAGLKKFKSIAEGDSSRKSFKRLHRWKYSPTACYGNNEVHLHPYLPRRINVAEALAIQSLPREFELPQDMTLSNMFKTVGNGVPYLMAKGLAEAVYRFLEQADEKTDSKQFGERHSRAAA